MSPSPFPDERRRRSRPAVGGAVTAVVVVIALVTVGAVALMAGLGPLGSDGGGSSPEDLDVDEVIEPEDGALPLGELVETGAGPGRGSRCPTGAECTQFTVDCPEVPDPAAGSVAISPPAADPRGVVVFFSGGKGSNWWEDGVRKGSGEASFLVADLQAAGYEVVQVRWESGFSTNPSGEPMGFARAACRSATAVRWAYDERYAPLGLDPPTGICGFCVSGNSGGSSQAAWGLTHYGLSEIVDAAVFTGGPPHAAIDTGCLQEGDEAYWYDASSARGFDEVYGAGRGEEGACTGHDDTFAELMDADSIDSGGTDYEYPATRVVFLFGTNDRTVAPTHAQDYVERLEEEGSPLVEVQEVQMGHEITQSQLGLEAIFDAITER